MDDFGFKYTTKFDMPLSHEAKLETLYFGSDWFEAEDRRR